MSLIDATDGIKIGPDTELNPRVQLLGFDVYIPASNVNLPEHFAAGAIETVVFTDCVQANIEQSIYMPRISGNYDLSVLSCENTAVGELTLRVKNQSASEFNGALNPIDIVIPMFRISPFE